MARAPRGSDLLTVLRGLGRVGSAALEIRSQEVTRAWATSSLRPILLEGGARVQEAVSTSFQQPQVLQHEVSKATSEAVARISMVTEGMKAYWATATPSAASETSQEPSAEYDPPYDPSVQELTIEDMMMQDAVSGHNDHQGYREGQYTDAFTGAQFVADTIAEGTRGTREEVTRRLSEFEPLLDITKTEEREITDEHLSAIDEKLSELESVAYGHQMDIVGRIRHHETIEETKDTESQERNLGRVRSQVPVSTSHETGRLEFDGAEVGKNKDTTASSQTVPEMSTEMMIMEEAASGHKDRMVSESIAFSADRTIADILSGVQQAADVMTESVSETEDTITRKLKEFEPLLDVSKIEEKEITEEHLEALSDKLSELQDVAFGHNLAIFKEVEHSKPVEEVLRDVTEQCIAKEETVKIADSTLAADGQNIAEVRDIRNFEKHLSSAVGQSSSGTEITDADKELNISLSQVARPVIVEELDTSAVHVEVHVPVKSEVEQNRAPVEDTNISLGGSTPLNTRLSTDIGVPEGTEFTTDVTPSPALSEVKVELSQVTPSDLLQAEVKATAEASTPPTVTVSAAAGIKSPTTRAEQAVGSNVMSPIPEPDRTDHTHASAHLDNAESGISTASAATVAAAAAVEKKSFKSPDDTLIKSVETNTDMSSSRPKPKLLGRKPLAKEKPKSRLAENAQARKVPHSRIGRLMSFGGLAAGLGVGTVAEVTRRTLGLNQGKNTGSLLDGSPFLTEANAKRIVDTLCRVRGAALKLGQMLSIQDSALINPQLQKIFERVRQSADFMPNWQLERAIVNQLGEDWRSMVATFDEHPFAAASIGQVHLATLHDGRSVAMKIQYPGVAEGIDSDINNLISTLKVANIIPEGLFVDSIIEVAKRELGWECDYVREAECTQRYRDLVQPYPEYYVPEVIPQLCSQQIFTTELIDGIPVDKCVDMDQDSRNYLCEKILRLCLMELFQFGFMQTDPNWSNFFYNSETEQVALLDFGACRDYSKEFVDKYIHLIHGAAMKDREKVLKYSQELGFLTGYEAKVMEDAHIDAIMILGEAFQEDRPFNFGDQNTTHRIQHLVPVMLSHRMCAPPEESYSLHRKMSGVFLLCTKLNGVVNCYRLFQKVYGNYRYGGTWEELQASLQQ